MNNAFLKFMTEHCQVFHPVAIKNETGQTDTTWTDAILESPEPEAQIKNVLCNIQALSGNQQMMYAGLGVDASYEGFFLIDEDIRLNDKVVVGDQVYWIKFIEKAYYHHQVAAMKLEVTTANV